MLLNKKCALLALASMAAGSQGFMTSRPTNSAAFWTSSRPSFTPLSVANDVMESVPIKITGNNVPLTDALQDYVNAKFDKTMSKFAESKLVKEITCHVSLSVNKNPSVAEGHTCEVVSMLAGGPTIRVEESSADMYTSIDLVSDRLGRKLRKFKERKLDGYHGGRSMGEDSANALNEVLEAEADEEDLNPTAAAEVGEDFVEMSIGSPEITKIKSFDLSKPISVKEAIFALDYIDHDFYVFRDAATSEISVVYKRNAGGVGLIQPSDQ